MDNFEQVIDHITSYNQEKNVMLVMKWQDSLWMWAMRGWVLKCGWGKGRKIAKLTGKNMVVKNSSKQWPRQQRDELLDSEVAESNDRAQKDDQGQH